MTIPPQNVQHEIFISNCTQVVDEFLSELTFEDHAARRASGAALLRSQLVRRHLRRSALGRNSFDTFIYLSVSESQFPTKRSA